MNNNNMNNLIIDATNEVVLLKIINDKESYTKEYSNSRENFDKISLIIFNFLKSNKLKVSEITNIFVNIGPGNFSGIRASLSACKAISISQKINLYGFSSTQINNKNYNKLLDLLRKEALIKDLIKPKYI
tara:strand:- start:314 stop:703 length:390 start_codon:yes stop_codon:yes gene_type:complete